MRLLLAIPVLFGLLGQADAECVNERPWSIYGQTMPIFQGAVDNPEANANGIIGEASWPYTVPAGKYLELTGFIGEAYAQVPYGLVYAPYIGASPPASNKPFLFSVYADNATNEARSIRFQIPAGKVLNLRIMSNENPAQVVGWAATGRLCDAP